TVDVGEKAIVCILGTGSNCTYYDGNGLDQKVTSLGYILMDEASGNFYGKQLIRSYYFNEMSPELAKKFEEEFVLDADVIKENIYRKENPNTYLATFSKFIIQHKDNPVFKEIIKKGIVRFVDHQILQFENCREVPIHFIGSISFFLEDELREVLETYGLKMGRIVRRPIDRLVSFHKEMLDSDF
ncbi:N-acetylglucosamine kinase, partial [Flavobacteriaceae bacterium]|nr:N-acetylglucosamine kinase [Flavobacteriaceae bacterium]